MKQLIAAVAARLGRCAGRLPLDYEQMVILDAESLTEAGIKEAYGMLMPILKKYLANPEALVEEIDCDLPSYSVVSAGVVYEIYSPALQMSEGDAWGRATYAFFAIINRQLKASAVKFYAIDNGNGLGGMFLSERQAAAACRNLKAKADWPYLPTLASPWYGQHH
ncbi:hypothetical protein [Chromobacterium subtsugae]|uniref:hypothetical protein n=1 Tax=Chromobacterium subtsugae TaxID=251747 RepID=UPI00064135A0|nr:hypothetical protein [Chromobacterium subtsugae]